MTITEPNPDPGATTAPGVPTAPPKPPLSTQLRDGLATAGEIFRFSANTVRGFRDVRHYSSEVLHQAGILVLSSGLIIWVMQGVMGTVCGLEASYTLKQIGAPLYSGIFNAYCSIREMAPYMWGYIFAAKVGCGLVAELGSMRISDEI